MSVKAPPLSSLGTSKSRWLIGQPDNDDRADRPHRRRLGRSCFPEFDGRVTVVLFWSMSCEASWERLDELSNLRRELPGLSVVAVHSPRYPYERDSSLVQAALERHQIDVPVLHDADLAVWGRFNPGGWPAAILVDAKGRAVGAALGLNHLHHLAEGAAHCLQRSGQDIGTFDPKNPISRPEVSSESPQPSRRPLAWPTGISILANGRVAVVDGHQRLLVYELDKRRRRGRLTHRFGLPSQPGKVAAWSDNSAAISLPRVGAVVGVDFDVDDEVVVLTNDLGRPQGITEDLDGSIVICDASRDCLVRISLEGQIGPIAGSGVTGTADGPASRAELAQPVAVDRTHAGLVFVDAASNRIRLLTDEGDVVSVSDGDFDHRGLLDGPAHRALLQRPAGVAADPENGSLIIADAGNNRIRRLHEGRLQTLGVVGLSGPEDVAILDDDLIIVADTGNSQLIVADLYSQAVWPLELRH